MIPRSRSQEFLSLRGIDWWRVVDLDLLFQTPQEYARIMRGMERK
jgi:hypothetical protein